MKSFKKWYSKNWFRFEGDSDISRPIYTTYRDKGFTKERCKRMGVKLDDFWWTTTYIAFEAFKAGKSQHGDA